jgi:hypothetical protein
MLKDDGTSLVWRSVGLLVVTTVARDVLQPVRHHIRRVDGEQQMVERLSSPAMRVRGVAAMSAIAIAAAGEGTLSPTTRGVLLGVGASVFANMLTDVLPVGKP